LEENELEALLPFRDISAEVLRVGRRSSGKERSFGSREFDWRR
jgi:hypothetical protein